MSNPPYYIAEDIIRASWDRLNWGGTMIFMLPLQFLSSVSRYRKLWRDIPLFEVGVLALRPSFYKSETGSSTNGTDYGIFVWRKGMSGRSVGKEREFHGRMLYNERNGSSVP